MSTGRDFRMKNGQWLPMASASKAAEHCLHHIWSNSVYLLQVVVQLFTHVRLFCDPMDCMQHTRLPCPSPFPGVCSKLMSIELVMPSNHLILCRPLFLLPSLFPGIRVFSNKSALLQVVFPFPGPHPLGIIPSTLPRGLLNSSCWATSSALLLLLFSGYVVSNSLQPHGL